MSARLGATLTLVGKEATELGRWWLDELDDMARAFLRRIAPRSFNDSVLTLGSDGGTLVTDDDGEPRALTIVAAPDDTWSFADAESATSRGAAGSRVRITMPDEDVFTYEVTLPASAERDLRSAIELDVERSLPIALGEMLVDFTVTHRQRDTGRIIVTVWAARRTRVQAIQARATGLGLRPVAIGVATASAGVAGNFLDERRPRAARSKRLDRLLVAGIATSAVVGIGTVVAQRLHERDLVQRELDTIEPQAAAAADLKRRIATRRPQFSELASIVRAPDGVDALAALTAAVPDEGWVQYVEIDASIGGPPELRWTSYAPAGSGLVETLQQSPDLVAITLVSTATLEGQPNRIELTAQLRAPELAAADL
jgi:type IV pilus assembly PilM-like protein